MPTIHFSPDPANHSPESQPSSSMSEILMQGADAPAVLQLFREFQEACGRSDMAAIIAGKAVQEEALIQEKTSEQIIADCQHNWQAEYQNIVGQIRTNAVVEDQGSWFIERLMEKGLNLRVMQVIGDDGEWVFYYLKTPGGWKRAGATPAGNAAALIPQIIQHREQQPSVPFVFPDPTVPAEMAQEAIAGYHRFQEFLLETSKPFGDYWDLEGIQRIEAEGEFSLDEIKQDIRTLLDSYSTDFRQKLAQAEVRSIAMDLSHGPAFEEPCVLIRSGWGIFTTMRQTDEGWRVLQTAHEDFAQWL